MSDKLKALSMAHLAGMMLANGFLVQEGEGEIVVRPKSKAKQPESLPNGVVLANDLQKLPLTPKAIEKLTAKIARTVFDVERMQAAEHKRQRRANRNDAPPTEGQTPGEGL